MRYVLGILFLLFFIGFGTSTFMLGGPTSEVYEWRDVLFVGALICAILSTIMLGLLAFGVGTRGKKRSPWRVPLLCVGVLILSLGAAAFILLEMPEGRTPQGGELNLRLAICAFMMIGFALFSVVSLIATLISTKKHNANLINQWGVANG